MQIDFSLVSENLAQNFGDAEAIVNIERGRRYSFSEYHRLTNRIVNMMRTRLALKRGDVWLNILNNDNLSLLSYFTAYKGEAAACYTNTTDSLPDQARQIDFVRPKVVFIEESLLATHYAMLHERGLTVVSMDRAGDQFPGVLYFWDLLEGVSEANPGVLHDDRKDCLLMRFTGGTTGAGKCVMYSVDNFMANKDLHFATADALPVPGLRFLHFGMISHASGMLFFPVLFKGGCTVTMNDRSLLTWCHAVASEKITGSLMVPVMLYRLLESPEAASADLSSLRLMVYGASPMSPAKLAQLRQRFGEIFVQLYGSSEHPVATTALSIADHSVDENAEHLWSAGKAVPGVELKVMGANGQAVRPGTEGEIWMRSRGICLGYLNNPEKTAEEFCDGFWKSGDVGRIDARGFVYVIDRTKDTIVCDGRSVYPSQVEGVISAHPMVSMAAVVGIPHAVHGEAVHAEVVLRAGTSLSAEEMQVYLRERLFAHNLPSTIRIADALPMSGVGKVLRRAVREACRKNAPQTVD